MKKHISKETKLLLSFLLLFIISPINISKAYDNGTLNGQLMRVSSTYNSATYTQSANMTDNNISTSDTLGVNTSTTDTAFYTFSSLKHIKSFKINFTGDVSVYFVDDNNTTIQYFTLTSNDGTNEIVLTNSNRYKVKGVYIANRSTTVESIIKEFDVFELETPMNGLLHNRMIQGISGDGKTHHSLNLATVSDKNNSTNVNIMGVSGASATSLTYFVFDLEEITDLTEFKVITNGKQIDIELFDKDNALITKKSGIATLDVQTISLNTNGVKSVKFYAPNASGYLLYDAELYGTKSTISTPPINEPVPIPSNDSGYTLFTPNKIDLGNIMISNKKQTISKPIGIIEAGDLTGSGQGWRLQIQSTVLSNGMYSFAENSLLLNAPKGISSVNNSTSPLPTINSGFPFFIDNGNDITILSSNVNEGMDSYKIDFSNIDAIMFDVPTNVKIGNYNSTITWKIVVGP